MSRIRKVGGMLNSSDKIASMVTLGMGPTKAKSMIHLHPLDIGSGGSSIQRRRHQSRNLWIEQQLLLDELLL